MKKFYWDRRPGYFVLRETGLVITPGPNFSGTDLEWNETLVDTLADLKTKMAPEDRCLYVFAHPDVLAKLTGSVFCKKGPGAPRLHCGEHEFVLFRDDERPINELDLFQGGFIIGKIVVLG